MRITLKDIAAKAGVHISTVSLALRDSPKLRKEMRERIQLIALELGYAPDAAMSALVAHRKDVNVSSFQSTIAWINNWENPSELRSIKSFNEYYLGALEQAERRGYKLEEFYPKADQLSPQRLESILYNRNIQGLLMAPQQYDNIKFQFDFSKFSAVALGYSLRSVSLHVTTNHQYLSMTTLITKLLSLGYRRIGLYLHPDWDKKANSASLAGYLSTLYGIPEADSLRPCISESVSSEHFLRWVRQEKPEVAITLGWGRRLIGWLQDEGVRVPEAMGVVDLSAHPSEPEVAGIDQNDRLVGQTAVEFLIGMIQRNERGVPKDVIYNLVAGKWQSGPSVRIQV